MKSRVRDLMTKEIKSIPPDMNAKDAMILLIESDLSGLPVIDSLDSLVGVFTEREILKEMLPAYVKQVGAFVYGEDPKSEVRKMAALEKFMVRDLMRKEIPTVGENASISEVSKIMLTKSERRVFVVKDKKVIGVITRCDVIRGFAKEAGVI